MQNMGINTGSKKIKNFKKLLEKYQKICFNCFVTKIKYLLGGKNNGKQKKESV